MDDGEPGRVVEVAAEDVIGALSVRDDRDASPVKNMAETHLARKLGEERCGSLRTRHEPSLGQFSGQGLSAHADGDTSRAGQASPVA